MMDDKFENGSPEQCSGEATPKEGMFSSSRREKYLGGV